MEEEKKRREVRFNTKKRFGLEEREGKKWFED
jgi:hypothetical protein